MQTTLSKFQPGKFQYLRTYFYCVIITLTEAVILFFKSCKIYVVLLSVFFFSFPKKPVLGKVVLGSKFIFSFHHQLVILIPFGFLG